MFAQTNTAFSPWKIKKQTGSSETVSNVARVQVQSAPCHAYQSPERMTRQCGTWHVLQHSMRRMCAKCADAKASENKHVTTSPVTSKAMQHGRNASSLLFSWHSVFTDCHERNICLNLLYKLFNWWHYCSIWNAFLSTFHVSFLQSGRCHCFIPAAAEARSPSGQALDKQRSNGSLPLNSRRIPRVYRLNSKHLYTNPLPSSPRPVLAVTHCSDSSKCTPHPHQEHWKPAYTTHSCVQLM